MFFPFHGKRIPSEREESYTVHPKGRRLILEIEKPDLFAWTVFPYYRYRDLVLEGELAFGRGNGHSAAGFIIRHSNDENFYYFLLSNRGYFRFDLVFNGNPMPLVDWTPSPLIEGGRLPLRIIARDNHFSFYISDHWICELDDDTVAEGRCGFAAQNYGEEQSGRFSLRRLLIESRPLAVEKAFLLWTEHVPINPTCRFNLARSFFNSGQFPASAVQLKKALRDRRGTAEEYALLGECLINLQAYEPALAAVERVLVLEPDHGEAPLEKANLLYLLGRLDDAAEYSRGISSRYQQNAALWNLLGNCEYALGRWQPALDAYEQAVSLEPEDPLFHVHYARSLESLGREDEAVDRYLQAARYYFRQEALEDLAALLPHLKRLKGEEPGVSALEAKMLYLEGRQEEAESIFHRLIDTEKVEDSALFYLQALIHIGRNERDQAQALLAKACALEPDYALYRMRFAENLFLMGENADEEAAAAYLLAPEDPWVNNLCGQICLHKGEVEKAAGYLESAVKAAPKEPAILVNYTDCLARRGELEKALELVRDRLAEDREASLLNHLGNLLVKKNSYREALQAYEDASRLAPDVPEYAKNIASVCIELDMVLKAEQILMDLEERFPHADVYNLIGHVALIQGEYRRAEMALQRGLELEPENQDLHVNLACVYLARKDEENARKAIERILSRDPENQAAQKLRERMRKELEEELECAGCGRSWWVPRLVEPQPALRIVGEPPDECPAGMCSDCGKTYCIQCAKTHLRDSRFVCPDCDSFLKLSDDRLKLLVSRYIGG